jgi:hypothetical protein
MLEGARSAQTRRRTAEITCPDCLNSRKEGAEVEPRFFCGTTEKSIAEKKRSAAALLAPTDASSHHTVAPAPSDGRTSGSRHTRLTNWFGPRIRTDNSTPPRMCSVIAKNALPALRTKSRALAEGRVWQTVLSHDTIADRRATEISPSTAVFSPCCPIARSV